MEPEQNVQALATSKNGKQSQHSLSVGVDESDAMKSRGLNPSSRWKALQLSVDIDKFDEPKSKGLDLHFLWRTIQRNVLLVTGIATVAIAASVHSALNSTQTYEGDFRLLVEPITSDAKLTEPSAISRAQQVTADVDYPTLLQVLQSPGLLSKIAKQLQARYPDVSSESLIKDLTIQRIGTDLSNFTKLIEVRYKGGDPTKVQFVLEELAKGYLKYSLENRKTRISLGVQFIEEQLPRLQQQVSSLQGKVQALQQHYKLSDPANDSADLSKQLHQIQAQKLDTQRELQEQKALYASLQKQLELAPNEVLAASTLSEDPNYKELLAELKRIESQIALSSAQFTEDNPTIQSLRQKQKNLSRLLNQEAQRITGQNQSSKARNSHVLNFQNSTRQALIKQLVDTANQTQVLEVRNQAVTKAEALFTQQLEQFPAITRQYNDLQRQLEIATKTLNQMLIQRETLRVEAAQKEIPWELVSEPRLPRDVVGNPVPLPSDAAKKLAIGAIAGCVLGLGAALLREKSRKVFYAAEDIQEAIIEVPILEVLPFGNSTKQFPEPGVTELIEKNEVKYSHASLSLETFSLYTSIGFLTSERPIHSLVVSSAEAGDGKTTIALHLAKAAALMGQRVLLVDANLQQPQIHTRLGLPNAQGLSNILVENLEPKDLIQRSPLEDNLFVLTAGQLLPNSTSLLASTRMPYLIEQFQTVFDLVIYDTPHLLGLADANFLAAHTDGILMVVGVGKTDRSVVMQLLHKLNSFHLPILAIVANHVEESTKSSYDSYKP
jgi:capsular exopolysaccharide synthesis family protein